MAWQKLIVAGLVAGVLSAVSQGLVWLFAGAPVVELFLRDARLTAALVLGRAIIDETNQWMVVVSWATTVHFVLSIGFAFAIIALTARLTFAHAVLVGGFLGLLLYVINLYGWTEAFPWFSASRSLNTALAHIVFGASAVWAYRRVTWRRRP